jgi:aminoglycoside phosphotransferase (APT) family kinase protein
MNTPTSPTWQEALRHVPGAGVDAQFEVQALAGGTTNATFRVKTSQGVFVVRLHEPYTLDLGVDRRREALLHGLAAQAGLASQILATDPQGRYLVTEFLAGARWRAVDLDDETRLWALAQTLSELHALPAPVATPLDLRGLLERHIARIAARNPAEVEDLLPQMARARDILARQADAGRPACIIHGDLSHENLIGAGQPRLIDWEYAAVADPLADVACLLAYYPQLLRQGATLLRRCGLPGSVSVLDLEDYAWVYRFLSNLWHRRLALARHYPPPAH